MNGFEAALRLLPESLREAARALPEEERQMIWEFRLRRGRLPTALLPEGERALRRTGGVSAEELQRVLELSCAASPYAVEESLRRGFVTAAQGVRGGFCGSAVTREGEVQTLKWLSSAVIRVPREVLGCAAPLCRVEFVPTLLLSPPGGGKTTLLRDMVRILSNGGARVALCDERGEVAAFHEGLPGFDVGERTDVITAAPKSRSALMLLRAMGPEILAMDEITAPEDVAACETVSNCGVLLLATAHGSGVEDLRRRPLYRTLLEKRIFRRCVVIRREGERRRYEETVLC